jgi:hypothetical protein
MIGMKRAGWLATTLKNSVWLSSEKRHERDVALDVALLPVESSQAALQLRVEGLDGRRLQTGQALGANVADLFVVLSRRRAMPCAVIGLSNAGMRAPSRRLPAALRHGI